LCANDIPHTNIHLFESTAILSSQLKTIPHQPTILVGDLKDFNLLHTEMSRTREEG
jgi:hypothetical protein